MARNQNTLEKRLREMEKKRKAEEKRARRQRRKDQPADGLGVESSGDTPDEPIPSED